MNKAQINLDAAMQKITTAICEMSPTMQPVLIERAANIKSDIQKLLDDCHIPYKHTKLMCKILLRYCEKHGLEKKSADDLYFDEIETENSKHAPWLSRFMDIWNRQEI